jgi:putative colanic acid biosysnthesis UDP-glucose lipid carrier transferase
MRRLSNYIKPFLLLIEIVLLNASFALASFIRYGEVLATTKEVKTIWLLSNLTWIALSLYFNSYKLVRIERLEMVLGKMLRLVFLFTLLVSLMIFLLDFDVIARIFFLYLVLLLLIFIPVSRLLFVFWLKWLRKNGYNLRKVIFVGQSKTSEELIEWINKDLSNGYKIIGYFQDSTENFNSLIPKLGEVSDVEEFISSNQVHEMYINLGTCSVQNVKELIKLADQYMIRLKFIPGFQGFTGLKKVTIDFYNHTPVIMLRKEPLENGFNRLVKKVFDVIFASFVIFGIFIWLFPILMILVKASSKGPIFFKQIRSGENNRHFVCYKFRSMRVHEPKFIQAKENDSRITRIGRIMRKTNLDELPQFFNVLFGQMSVVGPRPHPIELDEEFNNVIKNYRVRHFAKPGITGWAQVNGCRGETKTTDDMKKRVELDIFYIENWSILLDLRIICLTIFNMIRGEKNAY